MKRNNENQGVFFYLSMLFMLISFNSFSDNKLSIDVNYANLNGTANEIVYWSSSSDKKLSELIWNLDNVNLIGVGTTYNINENGSINFDFYMNADTGKSDMTDYDWTNYNSSNWTHWSNSPTDITKVYKLDLNFKYISSVRENLDFFIMAGYKLDIYKWVAIGGDYIYPSESGSLQDIPVISYNQYFNVPYVGLGAVLNMSNFSFTGKLIYSGAVIAKDEDTHHLRDLYFEEYFEGGKMLGLILRGEYNFTENFAILGSVDYSKYYLNKGYTIETDLTDGSTTTYGEGSAGIENETSMISLGLNYKF
ncbi:MAG: omptin family outer membrane protease [Fusobacteriaceae bacterium]|nr:omptin family outer membrane protease [Fusobacteriaceae bacterium]MBP6467463.1 omptin family outer membrane protease [Fusobacteriaceae bacterium]MBU9918536.1 omptin family outer membrane protease [Fusobacteriaceae bacterium]